MSVLARNSAPRFPSVSLTLESVRTHSLHIWQNSCIHTFIYYSLIFIAKV